MTNIIDYNFGPKEKFDLDNLDLDNIEFESIDDFIVFLNKMEDLDVNITFSSISEDTDLIMRIFEDEDNKDKAPLVWIYKIEEELADEDPDEWHLEYLTSKVIDRYVEKYGYKQFIELIEESPKLKELLFIKSMHASLDYFEQLMENDEFDLFCHYMEVVCSNEKIRANKGNDGYEYLIKCLARAAFYANDDKRRKYMDAIKSYGAHLSVLSAAVMNYHLMKNDPEASGEIKLAEYKRCLKIMQSNYSEENDDPGLVNKCTIDKCIAEIEKEKLQLKSNEQTLTTYKVNYIQDEENDDLEKDDWEYGEYDDEDEEDDDWMDRDISRRVFDDDGFGGEEMYDYDGELRDY